MEQQQVAEDAVDDERHRRHHRLRVAGGERVERIGDHRRGGDDGDELVDQRERVALEHRPAGRLLRPDEDELGAPLRRARGTARAGPCRSAATARSGRRPPRRRRSRGSRTAPRSRARRSGRRASARRCTPPGGRGTPAMNATDQAEQRGDRERRARRAPRRCRAPSRRAARRSRPAAAASRGARGRARASRTSLTRYAALEAAQYAAKATSASSQRVRVAELGREEQPGEEQQVLRPLPRPQRDERRARARDARRVESGDGHGADR